MLWSFADATETSIARPFAKTAARRRRLFESCEGGSEICDLLSQKGKPRPEEARVPASDLDIGGNIDRPRQLRIAGSALDELICIKLTKEHHADPVVIAWGSACDR
jgi:hypothetical protein